MIKYLSNFLFLILVFMGLVSGYSDLFSNDTHISKYLKAITRESDSTTKFIENYSDSVLKEYRDFYKHESNRYSVYSDSLALALKDSLPSQSLDSLKLLSHNLRLNSLEKPYKKQLDKITKTATESIKNILIDYKLLDNLSKEEVIFGTLENFRDTLSAIADDIINAITDTSDTYRDSTEYSCDDMCDSLLFYSFDLMINQINDTDDDVNSDDISEYTSNNQKDSETDTTTSEIKNNLILASDLKNAAAYRGRDGGVKQISLSPYLYYLHKTGLSAGMSLSILDKAKNKIDNGSIFIGYAFDLSDDINLDFSYTRSWFNKKSTLYKSSLPNNLGLTLSSSLFGFNIIPQVTFDFQTKSELSFFLDLSYPFVFEGLLGAKKLSIEPTLGYTFGEQNYELVKDRIIKVKGEKVTVPVNKKKSVFSVLDYSFTVPIKLDYNFFVLKVSLGIDNPMNVLDVSASKSYGIASIGISFWL